MQVKTVSVSPTYAKKLLEKNDKNRILNPRIVADYARDMKAGDWQDNGETIKLSKNNELLDGQHRLQAVINSGTTQNMLIVSGIEASNIETIDIGKKRTNADILAMNGFGKNPNCLAAAISICQDFKKGEYSWTKRRRTPIEAIRFIKKYPKINHSLKRMSQTRAMSQNLMPLSLFVALDFLFCQVDEKKATNFFYGLVYGENLNKTSPILHLRNRLLFDNERAKLTGRAQKMRTRAIGYCVEAFNLYVKNKGVSALEWQQGERIVIEKLER